MNIIIKILFLILCMGFISTLNGDPLQQVKVKPDAGTVALTFDDGPDPKYTPAILKILRENHIKATFFVVGELAKRHPDLIRAIHQDGHMIGNHSYDHPMLTHISFAKAQQEILKTNQVIENILGIKPLCFRPPYGAHNRRIDQYANSLGLAVLIWDTNSTDYNRPGVAKIIKDLTKHVHNRYILLLHDGGGNRQQTVDALPKIIQDLKAEGFGFDTICGK